MEVGWLAQAEIARGLISRRGGLQSDSERQVDP